jgi:hypothetical protein
VLFPLENDSRAFEFNDAWEFSLLNPMQNLRLSKLNSARSKVAAANSIFGAQSADASVVFLAQQGIGHPKYGAP